MTVSIIFKINTLLVDTDKLPLLGLGHTVAYLQRSGQISVEREREREFMGYLWAVLFQGNRKEIVKANGLIRLK